VPASAAAPRGKTVGASATVGEALGVTPRHLEIGQQVMAEGDRLRDLEVGEAGQWRGRFLLARSSSRSGTRQAGGDVVDRVAQIQANVGGHLVVARAAGMQALAGIADQRCQALLDVQVHVFEVERPDKAAASISRVTCAMPRSMSARSSLLMISCLASIVACASEARMS
jgi:hypothetical protein